MDILKTLANKRNVQIFSSEQLARTELAKIILAPDFYVLDREDFDISLLEINYASKFVELSHAQVLGTFWDRLVLNGKNWVILLLVTIKFKFL
ncbi:YlmH/Sll1252 family protein [Lactococcus lactis]|nr:YlmH/Sll1252 family protein [Lactococcus lactis]